MSDPDAESVAEVGDAVSRGRADIPHGARFGAVVVLLVLGYVLSPGPAMVALELVAGSLSAEQIDRMVTTVYAPLIQLSEKFPAVDSFYDWYLGLFGF